MKSQKKCFGERKDVSEVSYSIWNIPNKFRSELEQFNSFTHLDSVQYKDTRLNWLNDAAV